MKTRASQLSLLRPAQGRVRSLRRRFTAASVVVVKVYVAHESHPTEDCAPATVVIAAASRIEAVSGLRSAGFAARDLTVATNGSSEQRAALQEPGRVLWTDWTLEGDEPKWHRQR